MHRRKLTRAMQLFQEAQEQELGLRVRTNDASQLQAELGQARVQLRKEGIEDFDNLSFRVFKEEDAPCEYVFITKKLSPQQVVELIKGTKEKDHGSEET